MVIQTQVGRQVAANGANPNLRSNRTAALVVAMDGPKHADAALYGDVFIGANLGGTPVTTQAGLSATTPALTLYNPATSGVNLILMTVTVDITTAPAAAAGLMLAYGLVSEAAPATTTDATVTSAILGGNKTPAGKCYRIATLAAAPKAFRFIGGTTGAAAIGGAQFIDKVDGEVIIPPGGCISVQATSAAAILAAFTWEERAV